MRTTKTPNNDVINDDLAAPTRKETFQTNTASSSSSQLKPNLIKEKNSSPIIRELDTTFSTKIVSSKPSRVYFDVVIDKPSKQESLHNSETENCPVTEVKQTVKHSDE